MKLDIKERKEVPIDNIKVVLGETQAISHFTAVVTVLFSTEKFVMVRNKERGWEFPGGQRQENETYKETATREIFEETGAKVANIRLLGYYTSSGSHITLIACAKVSSFEATHESGEIAEVGLFEKLPDGLSFGDGREELFLDYAWETCLGQRISKENFL
jgi:8-oxo-dGTP diphosphatase